jgi:hypothetical protein
MRKYSILILLLAILTSSAIASEDPKIKLKSAKTDIESQLQFLDRFDLILEQKNHNAEEVKAAYPSEYEEYGRKKRKDGKVSESSEELGPLGIPPIFWGLGFGLLGGCILGLAGVLIVYLWADESDNRKKHVNNSLIGCLLGSLIAGLIFAILNGSIGYIDQKPKTDKEYLEKTEIKIA